MKTLFEDNEFLKVLEQLEGKEPEQVAPAQSFAPPPSNAVPIEKALNGFYTGKATQYAANYDSDFLAFAQRELPDAFSFWVQDIDSFVIRSRTGKMSMLEIKRNGYDCKEHQARTIAIISYLMDKAIKSTKGVVRIKENGKKRKFKIEWYGYNVLVLSNDSFENSSFTWNGRKVGKEMLKMLLAMETRILI